MKTTVNSVQFAGIFQHISNNVLSVDKTQQDQWILDPGATDHITSYLYLLTNVKKCSSMLYLPNGQTAKVTHTGTCYLTPTIILEPVLCVPNFSYNLLSISKLLALSSFTVSFSTHICALHDFTKRRDIETGRSKAGLYILTRSQFSTGINKCN